MDFFSCEIIGIILSLIIINNLFKFLYIINNINNSYQIIINKKSIKSKILI